MRELIVGTFLTLDGVMQAPGGPDEDHDGGFRHGGWLVPYFDEKFGDIMTEWTKRAGAFLLGRKTYEMFAASWPKSTDPKDEIATALNTRPKFVASRTLDKVTWNNSHLLKGDLAEEVAKLKEVRRSRSRSGEGDLRFRHGTLVMHHTRGQAGSTSPAADSGGSRRGSVANATGGAAGPPRSPRRPRAGSSRSRPGRAPIR